MNTIRPNRFELRKERTRNALKQAAIDLILEKGYDEVTVEDITERADLGRGTFYIHFKDKEDIVWRIIREGIETLDREANQQLGNQTLPQIEYYGYLMTFNHVDKNRALFKLMLGSRGSAALTEQVQQYVAGHIESEIKSGISLNDFNLPSEFVANSLTGALVRVILWWLEVPNNYTFTEVAGMFYQMMHHQLPPV